MLNHCHPLPPRWPWRWIGPRSRAAAAPKVPACFNKTSIQFFVDKLRRNERDGSTSSSSLHDSSSGSRHGPWQLPRLSSQRTSSRTKVTTRLLPLPGNQTSSSSLHDSTSGSRPTFLTSPCSQNTARAQQEHNQSTARAHPERSQSTVRAPPKSTARAQPEHSQSSSQSTARVQPKHSQSTVGDSRG